MRTRRDPWVALEAGADPRHWARELRTVHERVVSGGSPTAVLRPTIMASWQRSVAGGVRPEARGAPHVLDVDEVQERRRTHPLAAAMPAIRRVLHPAMAEAHHIMVVSDENGVLLWVEGPAREISRAADDMNFVPGSDWSEDGVGTNSIGTALAADHAIQVFSAEHFSTACHRWTCSGAPVHDPVTGRTIGAIDITSNLSVYHPSGHPLVLAAAQVAEGVLAEEQQRRDQRLGAHYLDNLNRGMRPPSAVASRDGRVLAAFPSGWVGTRPLQIPDGGGPLAREGLFAEPVLEGAGHLLVPMDASRGVEGVDPAPVLEVFARGRRVATCRLWGRAVELSPRHSEILTLLALHPEGLTGGQIAAALYADGSPGVTVRVEISRLRSLLGDVIDSRPYRLKARVRADFLTGDRGIGPQVDVPGLPAGGELLIGSTVPEIVALRDRLRRSVSDT